MNKTQMSVITVILTFVFAFSSPNDFSVNKPLDPELFTLFISLKKPFFENQKKVLALFKQKGLDAYTEDSVEVILLIDEIQLKKIFEVKLKKVELAASSSDQFIEYKVIENYHIPDWLTDYIESIYFDPQRS